MSWVGLHEHDDDEPVCGRGWRAPRADAPNSMDVNHICDRWMHHDGPCHCGCGKEST